MFRFNIIILILMIQKIQSQQQQQQQSEQTLIPTLDAACSVLYQKAHSSAIYTITLVPPRQQGSNNTIQQQASQSAYASFVSIADRTQIKRWDFDLQLMRFVQTAQTSIDNQPLWPESMAYYSQLDLLVVAFMNSKHITLYDPVTLAQLHSIVNEQAFYQQQMSKDLIGTQFAVVSGSSLNAKSPQLTIVQITTNNNKANFQQQQFPQLIQVDSLDLRQHANSYFSAICIINHSADMSVLVAAGDRYLSLIAVSPVDGTFIRDRQPLLTQDMPQFESPESVLSVPQFQQFINSDKESISFYRVVIGDYNGCVFVFNVSISLQQQQIATIEQTSQLQFPKNHVSMFQIDKNRIIRTLDTSLVLVDLNTMSLLEYINTKHTHQIWSVAKVGNFLISGEEDGNINAVDMRLSAQQCLEISQNTPPNAEGLSYTYVALIFLGLVCLFCFTLKITDMRREQEEEEFFNQNQHLDQSQSQQNIWSPSRKLNNNSNFLQVQSTSDMKRRQQEQRQLSPRKAHYIEMQYQRGPNQQQKNQYNFQWIQRSQENSNNQQKSATQLLTP